MSRRPVTAALFFFILLSFPVAGQPPTLAEVLHYAWRDGGMTDPLEEMRQKGVDILSSRDGNVRVFQWSDTTSRPLIQYRVADCVSRFYRRRPKLLPEDKLLEQVQIDSIIHLRGGVYLLRGKPLSPDSAAVERLFGMDLGTGIMKKDYLFETRSRHACFLESPVPFAFPGDEQLIAAGDTLQYNGNWFESMAARRKRLSTADGKGKFVITRLLFKDAVNLTVLQDELDPHAGLSFQIDVTHDPDEVDEIERETVSNSFECDFREGNPTVRIKYIPILNGTCYVENLDIVDLCDRQEKARRRPFNRWASMRPHTVAGLDEAMPCQHVRYTALAFPRVPTAKQAASVRWMLRVGDGGWQLLDTAQYKGIQADIVMLPEWEETKITVAPFVKKFDPKVSKTTLVANELSCWHEGGLTRLGPQHATTVTYTTAEPVAEPDPGQDEYDRYVIEQNAPFDALDRRGIMEAQTIADILAAILPEVEEYAACDSTTLFYNNVMRERFPSVMDWWSPDPNDTARMVEHLYWDDESSDRVLFVGKFLGSGRVLAIAVEPEDKRFSFYRLGFTRPDSPGWEKIGGYSYTDDSNFGFVRFEELDAEPGPEIVMATYPNMNANQRMVAFKYDAVDHLVTHAGEFSTGYTTHIRNGKAYLEEDYQGSWWMDGNKTLYLWHDNRLVPLRMSVMRVDGNGKTRKNRLEYYENPDPSVHMGLKLIFDERYNPKKTKHTHCWDDFFKSEAEHE